MEFINMKGQFLLGNQWKTSDSIIIRSFIGLILLVVYKSKHEALPSLWNGHKGRAISRVTITLRIFQDITRIVRFDDLTTRNE